MLAKTDVVRFWLGVDDVVIRDVQLWRELDPREVGNGSSVRLLKGRFHQYVDMRKIPLWVWGTADSSVDRLCFTTSSTTTAYFTSKLKYIHRGIVVEITHMDGGRGKIPNPQYVVLYRVAHKIRFMYIDWGFKLQFDSTITQAQDQSRQNNSIDAIIEQSRKRSVATSTQVSKNVQISEKRITFNGTLSKLILSGLRLRGIPNTGSQFQKLYKMTFDAAEFAHRDELQKISSHNYSQIPFDVLQDTVETLLKLFTKS